MPEMYYVVGYTDFTRIEDRCFVALMCTTLMQPSKGPRPTAMPPGEELAVENHVRPLGKPWERVKR